MSKDTNALASKEAGEYLYIALGIGEQMLTCGAEISRVEDTIRRICGSYGAEQVDVFTITSSIVVTMYSNVFGAVTQTRRITSSKYDLHRLDYLNNLSRQICEQHLSMETIKHRMEQGEAGRTYPLAVQFLTFALISSSFSIFFGGTAMDALISAFIGILLKCFDILCRKLALNVFLTALLSSLLGGIIAILSVRLGLGDSMDKISIGNIMLLIPGITLTK
jgi:uncharacterized membrane protein YjjP (DUF1212 family)